MKPTLKAIVIALCSVAFFTFSCYKIDAITQDHTAVTNGSLKGRITVVRDGTTTNGWVTHCYGLFGICVPDGWRVGADLVMTQVPKPGTDVGDDEYRSTIYRRMVANQAYTDLLNNKYPRPGYVWLGFATERDFKSLFNADDPDKEVEQIFGEFTIYTDDKTGRFSLDYMVGHVDVDKLDKLGVEKMDFVTRAATFRGPDINAVTRVDTSVVVTNPDGSGDNTEYAVPTVDSDWQLEAMPESFRTAFGYRDLKYDGLFTRTAGWNGGDGVFTVPLPNGDVLWTFNDSFYGKVDPDTRARKDCNFPRNSIMVQKYHDGQLGETPQDLVWLADYVYWQRPNNSRYMQCRTHLRHPLGEKTEAEIKAGDIDQGYVYWSGEGLVVDDKLQLLWFGVASSELRNVDAALATYSLDGGMPTGYYNASIPDYLPKEGDYLHMESVKHGINQYPVSYGSTIWDDEDGHIYLYASAGTNVVVARTTKRDLNSPWEFYVRNDKETEFVWQPDYPTDEQLQASNIIGCGDGCMIPWIFAKDGKYYLLTQAPFYSREVFIYQGEHPWGPFNEKRLLITLPEKLDKLGDPNYMHVYMVNVHSALSRQGELVLSTNTEPFDFWDNFNAVGSADFYRPYFYRVFGWEDLFKPTVASVESVIADPVRQQSDSPDYDLRGLPVDPSKPGIHISSGSKHLVK